MVYLCENKALAELPRPERPQVSCIIAGSPSELEVSGAALVLFTLFIHRRKLNQTKNPCEIAYENYFGEMFFFLPAFSTLL